MPMIEIDMTEVVAILVGGMLLMIPVIGLTLRVAVPPILRAMAELRASEARRDVRAGRTLPLAAPAVRARREPVPTREVALAELGT